MSDDLPILLRPHHGLCLVFFEGKGYSETFVEHMQEVRDILSPGSARSVRLTLGVDEICAACPHNINGICEHNERALRYDRGVLALCGLGEGVIDFAGFEELITKRILIPGLQRHICGGCRWINICAGAP